MTTGVPLTLPAGAPPVGVARPRVVIIADEHSDKVEQFTEAWTAVP